MKCISISFVCLLIQHYSCLDRNIVASMDVASAVILNKKMLCNSTYSEWVQGSDRNNIQSDHFIIARRIYRTQETAT